MRPRWLSAAVFLALAASASAEPRPVKTGLQYPEGLLLHGGVLYFTEMDANRIMASTDGETFREVWREDGCGPTSIAALAPGRFLINCHMSSGLRIWDVDANTTMRAPEPGAAPIMRPNDSTGDGAGGAFVSDSGEFAADAPRAGAVIHFDGARYRTIARGLHYANGVAYDVAARVLYVSEHFGRRVWKIADPMGSAKREVFWDYAKKPCAAAGRERWLFGPDGLELRPGGGLFVSIYGGEAVYELSAGGDCLSVRTLPAILVTSSVTDEARGALWVVSPALKANPRDGGLFKLPLRTP